ncbi:Rha family transcriptional regulator [Clostridium estertheticum]|uniref:Rha family transcriptional regulator n=1 Tax=Clostridium estertheticum TaxID=238834 RepID=UPI0021632E55|nr:Rha family transcriptional regulator [Clostridium estertheticum]
MNELEILTKNGQLVVSSRKVAENFEREHKTVLRSIEDIKTQIGTAQNCAMLFIENEYENSNKRQFKEYLLTRDGFSLLVMGFTGSKALNWKLKYITAFNEMEKTLAGIQPSWSDEMKGIFKLDQRTTETNARLDNFENTMPLFNTDCKDLQALVRKIATKVLGGYRTPAYKDNSLRGKVYADIQGQLRRQFGVERYESIKRIQIDTARTIVSNYILPMFLQDDITLLNNQLEIPFAYEN